MLKFPIPLGYLSEIYPDPIKKIDGGSKKMISLKVRLFHMDAFRTPLMIVRMLFLLSE